MTDSAPNETIEERLARVETKTDLVRQDLNEFMGETRSGFGAVQADMREMEVRLCKRQDEATATLRAELKDTTDGLRKEFQTTTDSLRNEFQTTTDSLRNEFQTTTDSLRNEFQTTTDSLRNDILDATKSLRNEILGTTQKISVGMADIRGYVKGVSLVIVPLAIAVLGLLVHLTLRG